MQPAIAAPPGVVPPPITPDLAVATRGLVKSYGDFPDCLAEMDAHVGEILDAVDDLRIRDNTIVVFTSDNGPEATHPWQGTSGPWRGYYFTHMEGSLRVPFIIRWPDRVPAGRVSNEIVHEADTYTTFARGTELMGGVYGFLDVTPKGRNEPPGGNLTSWVRRHDEYGQKA